MYQHTKYKPVSDRALIVEFGNSINIIINRKVHALNQIISRFHVQGVQECVPTYRSLLIYYDPAKISYESLVYQLKDLEQNIHEVNFPVKKSIEVPVIYGGNFGPDLNYVAKFHDLSEEEVIEIHTEREYTVYMIGFVAGFPYLGEVANAIATPRMETPRLQVPAGSVGIAGNQTGIYPCQSPGGWRIIGRTPQILFNPHKNPPSLLSPGDIIRLKPVEKENGRDLWDNNL